MPDINLPWQVVRTYHDDGATVIVSRHRTELRADIAAFLRDAAHILLPNPSGVRIGYEARRTPARTTTRGCVYCLADTTGPAEHTPGCPRYRPDPAPLSDRWADPT